VLAATNVSEYVARLQPGIPLALKAVGSGAGLHRLSGRIGFGPSAAKEIQREENAKE
jgi:ABC-type phosphate transport system substrate-binding protein